MFQNLINWWRNRRNFVIVDPGDNSITFSRSLFNHIKKLSGESDAQPKVFVFYIPATKCYGFILNPQFTHPAQLADIQYNSKFKCIGFESLNPTVAKILYDYDVLQYQKPCKLSVTFQMNNVRSYYQIERPHKKFAGYNYPHA